MRTKKLLAGACASLMIAASAITTVTAAESVNVTMVTQQLRQAKRLR